MLVMLVLAVRLTVSEAWRSPLSQRLGAAAQVAAGEVVVAVPELGAGFIFGCCGLTLAAGVAAGFAGKVRRRHVAWLGGILCIAALLAFSWGGAANKFAAIVGMCDLLTALVAGWVVAAAATTANQRRLIVAALAAIAAAWVMRGMIQWQIDIPDMIKLFEENREKMLASQGIALGEPSAKLFEDRLMGGEVGGYLAMVNVAAAGLVGLVSVLVGTLMAAGRFRTTLPAEEKAGNEVPVLAITLPVLGVLAAGAGLMTFLTQSKGGVAMMLAAAAGIVVGVLAWRIVVRWRRVLFAGAIVAAVAGGVAVIGYGVANDRLPSKTMTFRWHYWTASAEIASDHLWRGVGLNNFGDYYTTYKRPSAPEDVKDPHSYFVRLAAETGVPTTVVIGGLIVAVMCWAVRRKGATDEPEETQVFVPVGVGGVFVLVWLVARRVLADGADDYYTLLTMVFVPLTLGVFLAAWQVLGRLTANGLRAVTIAALVGAGGMLVYDQINTALVTGPVAMLFWVLLGLSVSGAVETAVKSRRKAPIFACAMVVLLAVNFAIGMYLAMVLSPLPHENAFVRHLVRRDFVEASKSLRWAVAFSPRSVDLLRWQVRLNKQLGQDVEADVRRIIDIDRANALVRVDLVRENPGLPAELKRQMLEDALRFDAALASDEPKKMKASDVADVQRSLAELRAMTQP